MQHATCASSPRSDSQKYERHSATSQGNAATPPAVAPQESNRWCQEATPVRLCCRRLQSPGPQRDTWPGVLQTPPGDIAHPNSQPPYRQLYWTRASLAATNALRQTDHGAVLLWALWLTIGVWTLTAATLTSSGAFPRNVKLATFSTARADGTTRELTATAWNEPPSPDSAITTQVVDGNYDLTSGLI